MTEPFVTRSVLRFAATSLVAALGVLAHARLAWRAGDRAPRGARRALAWFVPGVGVALAWRRGERVWSVIYLLIVLGYVWLRATA